jgi:hypothetical protein
LQHNPEVNVYDFLSLADGKAIPYGIYDLVHNHGFVNVGIDHDTAEFAVESIRRRWQQRGKTLYPGKRRLLITADGGGSNGVRNRLWKKPTGYATRSQTSKQKSKWYVPLTSCQDERKNREKKEKEKRKSLVCGKKREPPEREGEKWENGPSRREYPGRGEASSTACRQLTRLANREPG